jgi:hypothetical protein
MHAYCHDGRTFGDCQGRLAYHLGVRLVVLNGALIAMLAASIVGGSLLDRSEVSIEASVRRYAAAITDADVDAALQEIAPARRDEWHDVVADQAGNVYVVKGIAVRAPSLLDRLRTHVPAGPSEVTVVMDVNPGVAADELFQPTVRVPVEQVDGRWYLSEPLLAQA